MDFEVKNKNILKQEKKKKLLLNLKAFYTTLI